MVKNCKHSAIPSFKLNLEKYTEFEFWAVIYLMLRVWSKFKTWHQALCALCCISIKYHVTIENYHNKTAFSKSIWYENIEVR